MRERWQEAWQAIFNNLMFQQAATQLRQLWAFADTLTLQEIQALESPRGPSPQYDS